MSIPSHSQKSRSLGNKLHGHCEYYVLLLSPRGQEREWKTIFCCLRHQRDDRGSRMGFPLPKSLSMPFLKSSMEVYIYLLAKQFFKQ